MTQKYIDYYQNAILGHYENVKDDQDSDLLQDPSPGNLKKLCLLILERGVKNPSDKEVFINFFEKNEKLTLYQIIDGVKTDVLRTPSNFLRNGKKITKISHLNIVATLIEFEHRPFTVYKNYKIKEKSLDSEEKIEAEYSKKIEFKTEENTSHISIKEETLFTKKNKLNKKEISRKNTFAEKIIEEDFSEAKDHSKTERKDLQIVVTDKDVLTPRDKKKYYIALAIILFISLTGFFIHKSTEPKCMIWKDEHYEKIDCEQENISGFASFEKIRPYNKVLFRQRKIIPTDTTTFFKNNEPVLFYYGRNNYEFFTMDGLHPVNGKKLLPVSRRIVQKYLEKE